MVSVKSLIPAIAAAVVSTAALAADLPPPPPIAYQPPPPPVVAVASGWYLRGDVGIGIQDFKSFDHFQTNPAFVWPASWTINQHEIKDATILGFGIGYAFNSWLRFDVTGEYRTKIVGKAVGSYKEFCPNGGTCFDTFDFDHSAAVFMANTYIDLGTWWCITPYIGGGVGAAYQRITGLTDLGVISNGTVGFGLTANDSASWGLAWNVQAGLTYNVTNNFKIDFSWRFLDLGSPQTAVVNCQNTPVCPGAFYALHDLVSQDFRIGVRWMLLPEPPPVVMPQVVTKG
jgi:opacity protein-like surface antigen